jgi:putative ATP-dependent endonuclease of OLD family
LGVCRYAPFTDADFCNLNVANRISISLTIGCLDDGLKSMEAYGLFLRGINAATGETED